jgi:sec-independent protein translocase protein TatC
VQEGAYLYNDMAAYLSFVLYTMAAFGIVFELPLAIVLATQLGLIRREVLAAQRRVVFVVLVFVAAVVTPSQDPITLMIMAVPLYLLFEASLAVSKMLEAARIRRDAEVDGVGGVTR